MLGAGNRGVLLKGGKESYEGNSKGCDKGDNEANLTDGPSDRELIISEFILPPTNTHKHH